jgi:hypothetical protein
MMTGRCRIIPDIRSTANDDGAVLLNLSTGGVFSLNGVGGQIWAMLEQGLRIEEIPGSLSEEFGVPRQQVDRDVSAFLLKLEAKGLVQIVAKSTEAA